MAQNVLHVEHGRDVSSGSSVDSLLIECCTVTLCSDWNTIPRIVVTRAFVHICLRFGARDLGTSGSLETPMNPCTM